MSSVKPVRGVVWAGGVIVFLACAHTLVTLAVSARHIPSWLQGGMWAPDLFATLAAPPPVTGAFWISWGSFGVPLGLLGALVVRMGRAGQVPPLYVPCGITAWCLVAAVCFEPSPFATAAIPSIMLMLAWRRRRAETGTAVARVG
ncbi:DUF6463 family protein [Nonomuraea roseoviolacea]|uniref:Integral membrane protein n=1 Tax=Nonomuraea roseoviolacea subsp. carminata TaxID=160689 RepID=A0ABT1JUW7_9ACTN|nr:DUF6463 family protein [Nonomuraea roseoviolacea]MCP2345538.1 hypothetical protein [Nonomuraea roseoviolacea subsp. carminata]